MAFKQDHHRLEHVGDRRDHRRREAEHRADHEPADEPEQRRGEGRGDMLPDLAAGEELVERQRDRARRRRVERVDDAGAAQELPEQDQRGERQRLPDPALFQEPAHPPPPTGPTSAERSSQMRVEQRREARVPARGDEIARPRDRHRVAAGDARPRPARQQVDHVGDRLRLLEVVGDEQHGDALALDPGEQVLGDVVADDGVERGEGLVHQQEPRLQRQHLRQRHPLALAAGELARIAVLEAGEPEAVEPAVGLGQRLGRGEPVQLQPERHVLPRRAPRQQRVVLEQEAGLGGRDAELDRAAVRRVQPGDRAQHRALARARRPDQADDLAVADLEREPVDHRLGVAVAHAEVAHLHDRRSGERRRLGRERLGPARPGLRYHAGTTSVSSSVSRSRPGASTPPTSSALTTRAQASTSIATDSG